MRHVAQHAITALGSVVVAILWLTPFVERVLMSIWPVVAGALALVVLCSSLALCIWLLGLSLRALHPPPPAIEIIQGGGTTYARDITPAPTLDEDERIAHGEQWRVMVTRFCFIGNAVGFSVRKLDPYITRSKRQAYVDLLTAPGVLISDNESTRWAEGWGYGRLAMELKHRRLTLPYPTGDPPPVRWVSAGNAHTAHSAHTPRTPFTGPMIYSSAMGGR